MEHRLGTVIDAALEADCELPPGERLELVEVEGL